ncbi:hypothetical protein [Streptomyces sp. NPDC056069]|uniref:hypothetical protein n=1 Tax=Streptomyces sp. NPDC056069 TaxID=3345702 RepID=UPI0035D82B72
MTITGRGRVGRLIGAAFGLVFVQADVGTLPVRIGTPLRVPAAAAFVALVVPGRRTAPDGAAPGDGDDGLAAWRGPSLHLLGAGIAGCGAAGLALAAGGASASLIRVTAGVLPGALLLGSAWCAGRPRTGVTPTAC